MIYKILFFCSCSATLIGFSIHTISQQQQQQQQIQIHVEPSRIVSQRLGECNYNVFYEFCSAINTNEKHKFGLKSGQQHFYLNQVNFKLQEV